MGEGHYPDLRPCVCVHPSMFLELGCHSGSFSCKWPMLKGDPETYFWHRPVVDVIKLLPLWFGWPFIFQLNSKRCPSPYWVTELRFHLTLFLPSAPSHVVGFPGDSTRRTLSEESTEGRRRGFCSFVINICAMKLTGNFPERFSPGPVIPEAGGIGRGEGKNSLVLVLERTGDCFPPYPLVLTT